MKSLATVVVVLVLGSAAAARAEERAPNYERIRRALQSRTTAPVLSVSEKSIAKLLAPRRQARVSGPRDSVWNGALIGAAIGGAGGYIWARNICGSNDPECFAITAPVGVLAGAGIGAAIGAIGDALNK